MTAPSVPGPSVPVPAVPDTGQAGAGEPAARPGTGDAPIQRTGDQIQRALVQRAGDAQFLGQISSTPVGFVTAKGSPIATALSDAVNELIANGDYARIFAKWGVGGTEVSRSVLNPATTF